MSEDSTWRGQSLHDIVQTIRSENHPRLRSELTWLLELAATVGAPDDDRQEPDHRPGQATVEAHAALGRVEQSGHRGDDAGQHERGQADPGHRQPDRAGGVDVVADRTQQPDSGAPFTLIVADEITTNDAATGRSQRTVSGEITLIIEFCIPKGDTSAELAAHRARADIVRALGATVRGAAAGIRSIAVVSTRITDAPLGGTELVIAQVLARASLTESLPPA